MSFYEEIAASADMSKHPPTPNPYGISVGDYINPAGPRFLTESEYLANEEALEVGRQVAPMLHTFWADPDKPWAFPAYRGQGIVRLNGREFLITIEENKIV